MVPARRLQPEQPHLSLAAGEPAVLPANRSPRRRLTRRVTWVAAGSEQRPRALEAHGHAAEHPSTYRDARCAATGVNPGGRGPCGIWAARGSGGLAARSCSEVDGCLRVGCRAPELGDLAVADVADVRHRHLDRLTSAGGQTAYTAPRRARRWRAHRERPAGTCHRSPRPAC
jgi:hypothetical protein